MMATATTASAKLPRLNADNAADNVANNADTTDDPLVTPTQQGEALLRCQFVKSPRIGCFPWLQDELHFTYVRRTHSKTNGVTYYNCSERMEFFCPVTVAYSAQERDQFRTNGEAHTHPPNPAKLLAKQQERTVVEHITTDLYGRRVKPKQALAKIHQDLDTPRRRPARQFVSTLSVLSGKIRRALRRNGGSSAACPKTWAGLTTYQLPDKHAKMPDGTPFLRLVTVKLSHFC